MQRMAASRSSILPNNGNPCPCACSMENLDELAVYVGDVVQTRPRRPCLIYQELRFKPHDKILGDPRAKLAKIVFQNYYCASITVQQLLHNEDEDGGGGGGDSGNGDGGEGEGNDGNGTWTTVLYERQLMASPHYEDDAEGWHTIDVARDFNRNYRADRKFAPLRFYLAQPSPNWLSFELKHLACYAAVDKPRGPKPPFIDGCGPRFTWFGGETGYEPEDGRGRCEKCAALGKGKGGDGGAPGLRRERLQRDLGGHRRHVGRHRVLRTHDRPRAAARADARRVRAPVQGHPREETES